MNNSIKNYTSPLTKILRSTRFAGTALILAVGAMLFIPQARAEDVHEVIITANDLMKFDKTEFTVPVGKKIKLTLKNIGKMPKVAMGHNVVILKEGVKLNDFATAAMTAAATDYIPAAKKGEVLAHTKMLGGGETDTIEFTVPKAGKYPFLCSFPGHFGLMKGTMTAE